MVRSDLKILVAFEESQAVTKSFRELGYCANSLDILQCTGGHPEWHVQDEYNNHMDICEDLGLKYHLIIAFPPCTHIAVSGARWFPQKRKDGRQRKAVKQFMSVVYSPCKHIAIENPVGIMSTKYRKPDQIIQPWEFGDSFQKTTCLWLKNLPLLKPTKIVSKGEFITTASGKKMPAWYSNASKKNRSGIRSKTPIGIAKAMAQQYGSYLEDLYV